LRTPSTWATDLGAVAAGGSLLARGHIQAIWLVVPAALLVLGLQLFADYTVIFRTFKWLTLALFAYVLTGFLAHARPPRGPQGHLHSPS